MSILIIDPTYEDQKNIENVIRWIDGRRRVDFATDGAAGLSKALRNRPEIVFCEAELPDTTGGKLCSQLRERLCQTTFVAYTRQTEKVANDLEKNIFQHIINKPPSRWHTHAILLNAKTTRVEHLRHTSERLQSRVAEVAEIDVTVSIVGDQLRFIIPMPKAATVGMALQRLGKSIRYFILTRNGREVEADAMTVLQEGDQLAISVVQPECTRSAYLTRPPACPLFGVRPNTATLGGRSVT